MNKVEAFLAGTPAAGELEPLALVDAGPVISCTVDVAEGVAVGFALIAHAAQRAHRAGVHLATATRDIGFRPEPALLTANGAGAPGMAAHQLIGVLTDLA